MSVFVSLSTCIWKIVEAHKCSIDLLFRETLQNSLENTNSGVLFAVKLHTQARNFTKIRTLFQVWTPTGFLLHEMFQKGVSKKYFWLKNKSFQ